MRHFRWIALCVVALATAASAAPLRDNRAAPAPAAAVMAIVHATIHPASGAPLDDATLVVRSGRIAAVGRQAPPADATVVDGRGLHLYPSLIDADTPLGLVEIAAVRATRDTSELGPINPDARAEVAFNPDSQLLPVALSAGVLVAGVGPRGPLLAGSSAVMLLDGWTREDMTVKAPAGLYLRWPSLRVDRSPSARPTVKEQEKRVREAVRTLRDAFADARAYAKGQRDAEGRARHERDVKWEAMADLFDGKLPLVVSADGVDEIRAAVGFAAAEKLRMVLLGGADAWRVAPQLAKAGVGVIFNHMLALPHRDFEAYDTFYAAPGVLARAGVPVAISQGDDASNVRYLPDLAGRAVAYGMAPDEALRAITLTPARLLGVAHRLGSLEVGKDATFFAADGDVLDTRTHLLRAWILGREVDLHDRQKALYEKYRRRPRH